MGCLGMNLYWRFSDRTAAFAFRISVYENAVWRISKDELFWQILQRDLWMLSILFPTGLFSWGRILVGVFLCAGGFMMGMLTSGILLTEGVYWWLRGMLWMCPCLLCSGTVLGGEMYTIWKGTYCLQNCRHSYMRQMLTYAGHILLAICLAAMACRAESIVILYFFAKK